MISYNFIFKLHLHTFLGCSIKVLSVAHPAGQTRGIIWRKGLCERIDTVFPFSHVHTDSQYRFHTFLLCHWSRGSGANRETGQLMSHLYQHCFLHETDGLVKYSLSKVWPRSILAFHPSCQGMSFLSQLRLCDLSQSIPVKKRHPAAAERGKEKIIYVFTAILS